MIRVAIWKQLVRRKPYKGKDIADYYDIAQAMLEDGKHKAWKYIDKGTQHLCI